MWNSVVRDVKFDVKSDDILRAKCFSTSRVYTWDVKTFYVAYQWRPSSIRGLILYYCIVQKRKEKSKDTTVEEVFWVVLLWPRRPSICVRIRGVEGRVDATTLLRGPSVAYTSSERTGLNTTRTHTCSFTRAELPLVVFAPRLYVKKRHSLAKLTQHLYRDSNDILENTLINRQSCMYKRTIFILKLPYTCML